MLLVVDLVYLFFYIFGLLLNLVVIVCNFKIEKEYFVCVKVFLLLLWFIVVEDVDCGMVGIDFLFVDFYKLWFVFIEDIIVVYLD